MNIGIKIAIVLGCLILGFGLILFATSGKKPGNAEEWSNWARRKLHDDPPFDTQQLDYHFLEQNVIVITSNPVKAVIKPAPSALLPTIRKLCLISQGPGIATLQYTPSPLDKRGLAVDIKQFEPGQTNTLVILENGGTLLLGRSTPLLPVKIRIENGKSEAKPMK